MPFAPRRPCRHPGCPALVASGYCDAHQREAKPDYDAHRGSAHERGYGARWQKARKAYLIAHPLCVLCLALGRTVASFTVDHIIPHRGDMQLFWDHENWQALCKHCHDVKTAREDGGFGNRRAAGEP